MNRVTDIYLIKTANSVYEIKVIDAGATKRALCHKIGTAEVRRVQATNVDWIGRLTIGASFDVPGVVLTSIVTDYTHFVPALDETKRTTTPAFFNGLAEAVKAQVRQQVQEVS